MLSYCLKCKKILKALIQKYQQQVMAKQQYYQDVLFVTAENQNLLKHKKQKVY